MLYCPKCNQRYEDRSQRFCTNDNVRLIPAPGSGGQPRSVFTSVLNRAAQNSGRSNMFAEVPVLTSPEQKSPSAERKNFAPADLSEAIEETKLTAAAVTKNAAAKPEFRSLSIEPAAPVKTEPAENSALPNKPAARLIRPGEVPESRAALGDRAVNPAGRDALSWDNPEVLIGQTIKGRYVIDEKLGEDETGFIYLAEDKISGGRKVVVRVLMEEDAEDLSSRILAEERVSLSHVNHPNVAHLFDSGELLEGFPFIVSEFVDGKSLKESFATGGNFNLQRAARIVRQAANAVGEAHRNGVLHRNLKPKNIILGMSESGAEQVKITDFGVFDGFEAQNEENLAYLSPEQLQENYPTAASDIYSLAVIGFQLLTGRLPFEFSTAKELSRAQKENLKLTPSDLRRDAPALIDEILEKALAYDAAKRYPKARDFGDAFYNALMTNPPPAWKDEGGKFKVADEEKKSPKAFAIPKPIKNLIRNEDRKLSEEFAVKTDPASDEKPAIKPVEHEAEKPKPQGEMTWEKRSPEPIKPINAWRIGAIVLGLLLLFAAVWIIWSYFLHRPEQPSYVPQKTETTKQISDGRTETAEKNEEPAPTAEIDAPPPPRAIEPPPETSFFQNSKSNLKGDLLKNFRGFSFYYPKDWVRNPSQTNFVDVARVGATGTPIEQILVSYYDSKGTIAADKEIFSKLIEKSNKDLSAMISDYQVASKGETTVNGFKAYEVKFLGSGKTVNGDKITLWGRRLWIPAGRLDVKQGFVITMLATSNSPEVKGVEDVGVKGELAQVMETFEPAPLDTGY